MTAVDLAVEVADELTALHWTSHGNGATVAELVGALQLRGVLADVDPPRASTMVQLALMDVSHRVVVDDWYGEPIRRPIADGPLRGDWAVMAPR